MTALRTGSIPLFTATVVLLTATLAGGAGEPRPRAEVPPTFGLTPQLCTLQKSLPVGEALKELARQTGNTVEDRRQRDQSDDPIRLNFTKATFWQALDAIARQADCRVSLYGRERGVSLIDGPYREVPASYDGLFRTTVKRVVILRDLETEAHFGVAHLEIAWEPRVQAFFLEIQPQTVTVENDRGLKQPLVQESRGPIAVNSRPSIEMEIRFAAPARQSAQLGLLQGGLTAVVSGQNLVFSFANFQMEAVGKKERLAKEIRQTQQDVAVTLNKLDVNPANGIWQVGLAVKYPPGGPELESFQSTLGSNELFLVKNGRRQNSDGSSIDQNGNEAEVGFIFTDGNPPFLGKPNDWRIEYHTPGKPTQVKFRFEFRDVPLP